MADNKKLTFKIHKEGTTDLIDPKWREAEVENVSCPNCNERTMVVILGHKGILYAFCPGCRKYFIGE